MASSQKPIMLVGLDDSEHSFYALTWTIDHFFTPFAPNFPFKLCLLHAKTTVAYAIGAFGPGSHDVVPYVEADLKEKASKLIEKAKELCHSKSVPDVSAEIVEGDARYMLCEAVDKHHASMLVVGSHGYKALQRAVIGSVSDYCAHHAHCSVLIVKKPKIKH